MASGKAWPRSWRWVAPLSALVGWGCGAGFRPAPPGPSAASERAPWLEVQTPHYLMHTDLPELQAREMARSLEDARAALLASAWPGAKGPAGRTRVTVFARSTDFQRYTAVAGNVAGIALTRPGFERWLAFSPGAENGIPQVAKHEIVHDLSQWFLPLQPPWLAEGLAEYLEGFRFDAGRRNVVVGDVSSEQVAWLKQTKTLMSSTRLFAATAQHSADWREGVSFYAGSWFLVHYLLNQRGEAFERFQRSLTRLTPWRRAWETAFAGLTPAQLDEDMIRYAEEGHFSLVIEPFQPLDFEPVLRPLTPAQANGSRALLGAQRGLDVAPELEAVLKSEPGELSALTALFHSDAAQDPRERQDLAARAVAAHPDDGEAWLLAAWAAPEGDERRRALDRAFALAPHHPGVAWLLADDELQRGQPKRALELVRLAERRSGVVASMLAVHIGALLGLQRCEDAERLVESGASLLDSACQMPHPTSGRSVPCADVLRAAYALSEPSCGAAAHAANASPPSPQRR